MPYRYKTTQVKAPGNKEPLFHIRSAKQDPMTLDELAEQIANSSTVSMADIKAVLNALEFQIIQALKNGRTVRLGDIGSFYTNIQSTGVPTQADAWKQNVALIKHISCNFQRSKKISAALTPSQMNFEMSELEAHLKAEYEKKHGKIS